jgi:hypothetical protein
VAYHWSIAPKKIRVMPIIGMVRGISNRVNEMAINGIPSISDYSHWNEDAETMWYLENKYDMEHPEVFEETTLDYEDDFQIDPENCSHGVNESVNSRRDEYKCDDCDSILGTAADYYRKYGNDPFYPSGTDW